MAVGCREVRHVVEEIRARYDNGVPETLAGRDILTLLQEIDNLRAKLDDTSTTVVDMFSIVKCEKHAVKARRQSYQDFREAMYARGCEDCPADDLANLRRRMRVILPRFNQCCQNYDDLAASFLKIDDLIKGWREDTAIQTIWLARQTCANELSALLNLPTVDPFDLGKEAE